VHTPQHTGSAGQQATDRPDAAPGRWRSDLGFIAVAVLAWYALSSVLDLHELFAGWAAGFERWQLDELPFAAIVLALGLGWYALRRRRELCDELARRVAAEARASTLLAHNRELAQQLIHVQEAERLALARELHDELGQRCSAILVETASLRRMPADDRAGLLGAAARADVAAQGLYLLLRGVLNRLRPAQLDVLGLPAALQDLCETWETRSGVACVFHHDGPLQALPDMVNISLYRVVQESLTNVLRHADAQNVHVVLHAAADGLTLTVQDDGQGMDVAARPHGLGLLGAAERAAAAGGELHLHSAPGQGLRLQMWLPLPAFVSPSEPASGPAAGWRQAA
jgi:signal transduction histidine kinase